jgi:RNA polymerase sigma-70 factor, ECF subfamily
MADSSVSGKRSERIQGIDVERALDVSPKRPAEIVALDDALNEPARLAPRKARIVELRFFGGLEVKGTAEIVGVSPDTVMRDWRVAKAWLLKELTAV